MYRTRISAVSAIVLTVIFAIPAQASLVGDTVNGSAEAYLAGSLQASIFDTSAVVGGGREFQGSFFGSFATMFADLSGDTLTIGAEASLSGGVNKFTGSSFLYNFSDLDWLPTPGSITGLTLIDSGNNTTNANDGWHTDPGSWTINTTADTISIDTIGGWDLDGGFDPTGVYQTWATFHIDTVHAEVVPVPGAVMLGLFGLPLVAFMKRRLS